MKYEIKFKTILYGVENICWIFRNTEHSPYTCLTRKNYIFTNRFYLPIVVFKSFFFQFQSLLVVYRHILSASEHFLAAYGLFIRGYRHLIRGYGIIIEAYGLVIDGYGILLRRNYLLINTRLTLLIGSKSSLKIILSYSFTANFIV